MKSTNISIGFLFIIFSVIPQFILAQDSSQDQESMQKAWMEYMAPGWAHEMMARYEGEWKTVIKLWMDPSQEPMVTEGSTKNEMIMGGRYLKSIHKGTMMDMPFEGMSLEGYDNAAKEFTNIWIDNMGTGFTTAKGKYNASTKTLEFKGSMADPSTGSDIQFRETFKEIDNNKHVFEMYMNHDGEEIKTMEIEFTRKQTEID